MSILQQIARNRVVFVWLWLLHGVAIRTRCRAAHRICFWWCVVHDAMCRLRHRPLHLDGAARLGEAQRPTGACAC